MWNKPFKPPLLKQVPKPAVRDVQDVQDDPFETSSPPRPAKKRRLLIHVVDDSPPQSRTRPTHSPAANAPRKPLLSVTNPVAAAQAASPPSDGQEGYYLILWYFPRILIRESSIC
jgi:DNA repair and recombination protein RAD54B